LSTFFAFLDSRTAETRIAKANSGITNYRHSFASGLFRSRVEILQFSHISRERRHWVN